MSALGLAKKIFIPNSDHRFKFKAHEGYLLRLEKMLGEKGIPLLEKTGTMLRFRCKDTQIGGWCISAHQIEVIAEEVSENTYEVFIRYYGVRNFGILITIILWALVIFQFLHHEYSDLGILIPCAIFFPHLTIGSMVYTVAWRTELGLSTPRLMLKKAD